MTRRPYFILAGGYDTKNIGDYAMLKPLQEILQARGYALKLLSRHNHAHLRDLYGVLEILENYEYETRSQSEGKFFRGLNYGEDDAHLTRLADDVSNSEGLIIGGGRLLIDYTLDVMHGPLPYYALLITLCKFLGTPVHIYAMTIVDNKTQTGNSWLRFITDNSTKICVRDVDSVIALKRIGCERPEPTVLPDPAFCLPWLHTSPEPDPAAEGTVVGLTVRPISEKWGGMSLDNYIGHMAETVAAIQDCDRGLSVEGIPHQFYGVDDPEYDDRYILEKIHERTPFRLGYLEREMLDLEDYRATYSRLTALVGIRRHSFAFAALLNTPIIPVVENPNASRICQQLETIPPLPLAYRLSDFERTLLELLDRKAEICGKQNEAVGRLSAGLTEQYDQWLFGE